MVQYGTAWYSMVQYGTVCYSMAQCSLVQWAGWGVLVSWSPYLSPVMDDGALGQDTHMVVWYIASHNTVTFPRQK